MLALIAALASTAWCETVVRSGHWEVRSSGDEAEAQDWLAMLEAAWPQYVEFFGAEPKEKDPLVVRVFETKADMNAEKTDGERNSPNS